jgi:S-(hydroxymethyl)glutathione dehydrogenase/alcohol dehydrogenase
MRAGVWTGVDEPLSVEDVTPLAPGATDVVVRVDASGVCHTDHAVLHGQLPYAAPSILGHEVAGTVVEAGPQVTRVAVGDRVITAGLPACGRCFVCVQGQPYLCEATFAVSGMPRAQRADGTSVGVFAGLGGFAEQMTVDERSVVPVDTDLPAEQLALIGCAITTGVGSVFNTARLPPGSTVTVVGLGGIGQSIVQGARIAGASRVFAVDPVASKREAALRHGATDSIDPAEGDPVEQVRARTQGRGTDHAFEAVGHPEPMMTAYHAARRGGVVTLVGMPPADSTITFRAFELFLDVKEIRVSNLGNAQILRDFPRLVGLAETGRLDLASMVTRRIALDDINDAFRAMDAGEEIRTVVA